MARHYGGAYLVGRVMLPGIVGHYAFVVECLLLSDIKDVVGKCVPSIVLR